ncbi:MAG: Lsr2 family DNA-binding protein [Mycobacteriales bacterium]
MAERTLTICDFDERAGNVVGSDVHIQVSIGSETYQADLCTKHADALKVAVAPFVGAVRARRGRPRKSSGGARKASTARAAKSAPAKATRKASGRVAKRATARKRTAGPSPDAVRAWARANGVAVSDRGRLSKTLLEQYAASAG